MQEMAWSTGAKKALRKLGDLPKKARKRHGGSFLVNEAGYMTVAFLISKERHIKEGVHCDAIVCG